MYTVHEQATEVHDCLQRSYYANSFIGRDEGACVSLVKTSFVLEPKLVWTWRRRHLWLETKVFSDGD